ncbi:hypothetical protein GCM10009560_76180 [Nonomuraea longicatena]|uniref:Uncharacterized protein n=1 Tax=Nonomuraea longicatena TaxID=83682 RepID=A0ABN1R8A7_9ACTN
MRTPETRVWDETAALCGQWATVGNHWGEPCIWEPLTDTVCDACFQALDREPTTQPTPSETGAVGAGAASPAHARAR